MTSRASAIAYPTHHPALAHPAFDAFKSDTSDLTKRLTGFGPWRHKETIFFILIAGLLRGFAVEFMGRFAPLGYLLLAASGAFCILALVQFMAALNGEKSFGDPLVALKKIGAPLASGAGLALLIATAALVAGERHAAYYILNGVLFTADAIAFVQPDITSIGGAAGLAMVVAIAFSYRSGALALQAPTLRTVMLMTAAISAGTAIVYGLNVTHRAFSPVLKALTAETNASIKNLIHFAIAISFSTLRLMALGWIALTMSRFIARART